jgi:CRP/FNR family cyclic AMP-dependent transcriptional regulator
VRRADQAAMSQPPATPIPSDPSADAAAAWSPSLQRLAARGVVKRFRSGTQFITEGEPGDTLYIVLEGRLRTFSECADGREVRYAEYGPGDYVGEMSLDGGLRAANVATLTPCRLAMVTRATLQAHLAEEPAFAFELLAKAIRRARAATVGLREIALNDVYGRLKRRLDEKAGPDPGGGRVIAAPPSHATLAASIGCTRSMVSRVLKDLERGGWLVVVPRGGWRLPRELPAKW